ncbi:hypothetical protein ACFV1N_39530 [Streptosporangium canum]|uniref:hypothetical protein n=1 Tax=Streptosporangium canum TaxID=324952 RepID=UPI0036C15CB8
MVHLLRPGPLEHPELPGERTGDIAMWRPPVNQMPPPAFLSALAAVNDTPTVEHPHLAMAFLELEVQGPLSAADRRGLEAARRCAVDFMRAVEALGERVVGPFADSFRGDVRQVS